MRYFLVQPDKNIKQKTGFQSNFDQLNLEDLSPQHAHKIKDRLHLQIEDGNPTVFPDIMVKPALILTEVGKEVLSFYEPNISYKQVFCSNSISTQFYILPIVSEVECLSPLTVSISRGIDAPKIVLNEKTIRHYSIVKIAEFKKPQYIMRLDLAESLLMRNMRGIILKEVETV